MADSFPWSIVIFGDIVGAGEKCSAGSFVSFESVAVAMLAIYPHRRCVGSTYLRLNERLQPLHSYGL